MTVTLFQGGVSGPVALTGYVIVALLEADMNSEVSSIWFRSGFWATQ